MGERAWTAHWPAGLDEAAIRLPAAPITASLRAQARAGPGRPALLFYGRVVPYAELDEASDRVAAWLAGQGVQPGDRVALYLENSPPFAFAYFGIFKAGAVAVCVNPMHKAAELTHQLADSGARVVVTAAEGAATVAGVRERVPLRAVAVARYADFLPGRPSLPVPPSLRHDPPRPAGTVDFQAALAAAGPAPAPEVPLAAPALIQYTSGTTGVPKGAVLTHGNLTASTELRRRFSGYGGDDVFLSVLPWFHITGQMQLNAAVHVGSPVVVLGRFDVDTVLQAIERHRPTVTTFITTINVALLSSPRLATTDLSSLRITGSGGAPVPADVARRWEAATGRPLVEGYGMTETTAPSHVNPTHRPKYGTVGVPLPLTDSRIVSVEDGVTPLGPGRTGEIVVRGPHVMQGYWRQPGATALVLRDGWLHTGDLGRMDEEGYFVVEDRKKDLVKASGYSVFPAEVEALMYRHPAIAEVAVVGVPDAYRGEDVVACVVLRPEARGRVSPADLVAWCRQEMAVYKAPRRVELVEVLPKTASGKLWKRVLRERLAAAGAGSAPPGVPAPDPAARPGPGPAGPAAVRAPAGPSAPP
jgi:acyl-CoA synthetase (AMP-forming)/AMP-acid ligase II